MRLSWITQVGLLSGDKCPFKRQEEEREGHMKREADISHRVPSLSYFTGKKTETQRGQEEAEVGRKLFCFQPVLLTSTLGCQIRGAIQLPLFGPLIKPALHRDLAQPCSSVRAKSAEK